MNTNSPIVFKLEQHLLGVSVNGQPGRTIVRQEVRPSPQQDARDKTTNNPTEDSPSNSNSKDLKLAMQMVGEIHEKLASLEQCHSNSLRFIREMAVELSIAVTSKVLSQSIDEGSFPFQEIAGRLIEEAGIERNEQPIKVSVNKSDLEALQAHLSHQDDVSIEDDSIHWQPCSHLQRGSLELNVDKYSLLFDTALHLQEIRRAVLEAIDDSKFEN